jgi:farnesyl diphosphate synthase
MHRRKTGALLQASVLMGAACGDCPPAAWAALADYGAAVGLAFQVVDDILDVTQESQTLGKTAGKDVDPTSRPMSPCSASARRGPTRRRCGARPMRRWRAAACPRWPALALLADRVVERDN